MKYSSLALSCILLSSIGLISCTDVKTPSKSPEIKHGTSQMPPSRQYYCWDQQDFNNGSANIKNAACRAAFTAAGDADWERARLFNDWNAYSQNIPEGTKPEDVAPDGKLCSAGQDRFDSINLKSAAWHTTDLDVKDGRVQLTYVASQMHDPSEFKVYLTDPDNLNWAALKQSPDVKVRLAPDTKGPGTYYLDVQLPAGYVTDSKSVIFIMWQRHEDPARETFFSCSDVVLVNAKG
ncbi:lytic polysaccharide monooxygenase auxiliary activity family 9 protein [Pseudomonas sp. D1-1]|uniref:lytic polysaccharide monooxygenase auxiliary activity family 9 protein n=1 Tax=Pseudomonas sp. D1-1 TaxID=1040793 RepID=UPI003DA969C6